MAQWACIAANRGHLMPLSVELGLHGRGFSCGDGKVSPRPSRLVAGSQPFSPSSPASIPGQASVTWAGS